MLRKLKSFSKSTLFKLAGAVLSAVLAACAFPPVSDKTSAWIAIVPLFLIAREVKPGESFRWGMVSGCLFWLINLSWLLRLVPNGGSVPVYISGPFVTLGWMLLSFYCALYTGLFMALLSMVNSARHRWPVLGETAVILAAPVLWAGAEYLRSTLFTGFPWNCLGVSQYLNLPLIQAADVGGVYLVSAVIVLMNAALAGTAARFIDVYVHRRARRRTLRFGLVIGLLGVSIVFFNGISRVKLHDSIRKGRTAVRVSAVQPNIPQASKWSPEHEETIFQRLSDFTELAALSKPDLIVWPETTLPYCLMSNADCYYFSAGLARGGVPLLIGSMELDGHPDDPGTKCYNSSFLMGTDGRVAARYRKIHLVPFGEYFPFDKYFKFLQKFVPIGITCYPGREYVVFDLGSASETRQKGTVKFAALICFEDIMAYVARNAVRNGAALIINQTNDAWFEGSSAHIQHMSHCVFRCVENRVPAVRSGNTGVTCFIDSSGRIDRTTLDMLKDGTIGSTRYRTSMVTVSDDNISPTLYTRFGDLLFGIPAAVLCVLGLAWLVYCRFSVSLDS